MFFYFRKNMGWAIILLLSMLPVAVWVFMSPLGFRFFDLNSTMTSLGQIAGISGMTLFSINLILSSRLKIFDKLFWGLNKLYNQHHTIGSISFSLLLFHPLFLAVKYLAISTRSAALFFSPFGNLPGVNFGIFALFLMIILLAITFYGSFKYQNWKLTHKFMVASFVFAILHSLFVSSDISRSDILRFYILGFAFLGLAAGFWRAFLSRFFNRNFKYEIKQITRLNKEIVEIKAEPKGKPIDFVPGQFIFVSFRSFSVSSEIHPFSISSSPSDSDFVLVIKSLGDFTATLKNLKPGEIISIEGPFGKFSHKNISNKNQVWLAGGVGITPFLSMARSLRNNGYNIDLYYCTGSKEEAVFLNELQNIASENKNFRMVSWCSSEKGRIDAQTICDLSGGLAQKEILICGPLPFMKSLKEQLLKLNVRRRSIYLEEFNFL